MPAKPIIIADVEYPGRGVLEALLRDLLAAGGPDNEIADPAAATLLNALFHARPDKVDELAGRRIVGWGREANPMNQCFAALLTTGEKLHFSFRESIDALYAAQERAIRR